MPKNVRIILFWFPVILWMGLIFFLSSFNKLQASPIAWKDFVIRKLAHLTEYFILYCLLFRALKNTGNLKGWKLLITCLVITFLYAITDEYHQTFVSGRSGKSTDVGFDVLGAVTGLLFFYKLICFLPKKIREYIV